jgi:hypothetical protein
VAVKRIPVIISILEYRSARHYCCACMFLVFLFLSNFVLFLFFLVVYYRFSSLEYCVIRINCIFFKFVFWQLICDMQIHNLWPPFKILFYLVSPIVFSFRANALFLFGTICRILRNATNVSHWMFHDNAIWTHCRCFKIKNFASSC